MKLRNKKTGEIKEVIVGGYPVSGKTKMWKCSEMDANEEAGYKTLGTYSSLAELNAEWEDAPEEPKEYWCIDWTEESRLFKSEHEDKCDDFNKEIGNYFESKEEAKKAVEKLKAWKRLKDNGFKIKDWKFTPDMKQIQGNYVKIEAEIPQILINEKDLDICFGGEE